MDPETSELFRRGRLVVLLDDGLSPQPPVLVAAADALDAVTMAEMVRHTSGFVTVSLPAERCDTLGLPSLTHDPMSRVRPVPGVAVDARAGVGTGISATDRCRTAHVLADPHSTATDLCRPGHVVPMRVPMGAPRGADPRSRQVFAAMDLCELAGCAPAVVASVLVDATGEVMTDDSARAFAAGNGHPVLLSSEVPAPAERLTLLTAAS